MSLAADHDLERSLARLAPYARTLLDRAAAHALRLHAEAVTPDHLLSALMDDEDCAAVAAVLHGFADPRTISDEALAISPGVMVVASGSTLPFSSAAIRALEEARARSAGEPEVRLETVFWAAVAVLPPGARTRLDSGGLRSPPDAPAAHGGGLPGAGEPFFRRFSAESKRALSAANRAASSLRLAAIGPAHLVLGCLQGGDEVVAAAGLGYSRARLLLADRTADDAPPPDRPLPADPSLGRFLRGLPEAATSLDLLARFLAGETPELAQILARSKLSPELIDRARVAFRDPPVGA